MRENKRNEEKIRNREKVELEASAAAITRARRTWVLTFEGGSWVVVDDGKDLWLRVGGSFDSFLSETKGMSEGRGKSNERRV